jgi:hypothetical protein
VSLLGPGGPRPSFALSHWGAIWGDLGRFSMVVNPVNGKPLVYDALEDPLQQTDISAAHPEIVEAVRNQAEEERELVNYLLEANRVWQSSPTISAPEATAQR